MGSDPLRAVRLDRLVILLAVDTAIDMVSVALHDGDRVVAQAEALSDRRHAELLVPMIDAVRRQAGVEMRDVTALAVDVGPGLFTGMRVGVATVKALAEVLDLDIQVVTSTEVVAVASGAVTPVVAPVLDARRGQVFWALHATDGGEIVGARVGTLEECVADVVDRGQPTTFVGTGAVRYEEQLRESMRLSGVVADFASAERARPTAATLAGIVRRVGRVRPPLPTDRVAPLYLRAPDAEIKWETRR